MFDEEMTAAELRAMGAGFDADVMLRTRDLFRPALREQPWSTLVPVADVAYGEHERQRLDLYPSAEPGGPVALFVHGGGFVAGDKAGDPDFYGNVPRYFARHGYLGAAMNYRLAPSAGWPAGSEDVASALTWLHRHAAEHGGDPDRIVVLGQSAGAAHTAGVLFDDRFEVPAAVRGAALLSGFYRAGPEIDGGPRLYFGEDESAWADRSPLTHVRAGHPPVLLSLAEFDPAPIAEQTLLLAEALTRADGHPPRLRTFEDQNHVSPVHGLGLGSDPVGAVLRAYFDTLLG